MAEILVKGKPWHYEASDYYEASEIPLNHDDAKYLLLMVKEVLDAKGITFMPMFGTLLGIIRENGFIKNDHDMDVMIYEEDLLKLIDSIPELDKVGIKFSRCSEPWVYTFVYKSADCDFYPIIKSGFPYSKYIKVLDQYMPKSLFSETEKVEFLGTTFDIPKNPIKILEYCYGKNWRIPASKAATIMAPELIHLRVWAFCKRALSYFYRHFIKRNN